jgi:thymidylate kinase
VEFEWCLYSEQGLPRPDLVLQLDIENFEMIKQKLNNSEEILEKEAYFKRIRKEFETYFHSYKYWRLIDGSRDKEVVHKHIVETIEKCYKDYNSSDCDDFRRNFYPNSIGEDLFLYKEMI